MAKLASLTQDRAEADRRLGQAEQHRDAVVGDHNLAKKLLVEHDERRWLNEAVKELIDQPEQDYERLTPNCGVWPHDREYIDGSLEKLRHLVKMATGAVRKAARTEDLRATSFEVFRHDHALPSATPLERMVSHRVFSDEQDQKHQHDFEQAIQAAERAREGKKEEEHRAAVDSITRERIARRTAALQNLPELEAKPEEGQRLAAEEAAKQTLVDQADRQYNDAVDQQKIARTPPNIRAAICVLVYLAIVGVALPSTLLAFEPTALAVAWRIVLVALLAVGIGALSVVLYRNFKG